MTSSRSNLKSPPAIEEWTQTKKAKKKKKKKNAHVSTLADPVLHATPQDQTTVGNITLSFHQANIGNTDDASNSQTSSQRRDYKNESDEDVKTEDTG
jgi:hypothetical protein